MSSVRIFGFFLLLLTIGITATAQVSSSSSASSSFSTSGPAEVRLGGFVFEAGVWVALEIVGDEALACFHEAVSVEGLQLMDAAGEVIRDEPYSDPIAIPDWLGRVHLVDSAGFPLPLGDYSLVVATSVGAFIAEIEIAEPNRFARMGRYSATASVCGLSLRVYRLATEADHGTLITLRVGDRLLVALEGNPTTGYEWENTIIYEYAVLREFEGVEFRPDSALIGAGGLFLFRYEAIDIGPQDFHFDYRRAWELGDPLQRVEFQISVD